MHHLRVEHRAAENLAFANVVDSLVEQPSAPRCVRRGPQALLLELQHLVGEAHAFLADAVALRHTHVVEMDLRGVGGHHADLADLLRNVTPLVFIGRQMRVLFLCAVPSTVFASRHIQSACGPLVIHILPPLIT